MSWEPIETAPKDGRFIDAYDSFSGERKILQWGKDYQYYKEGWVYHKDFGDYGGGNVLWEETPTHWMPLPEKPKEIP